MKRTFLGKLQRVALLNMLGALVLLLVVPILQLLVLGPQGYGAALVTLQSSLAWIQRHVALFLIYRLALLLGFALLLGLPFALFRIIVAQEIVGRAELAGDEHEDGDESEDEDEQLATEDKQSAMPAFAWRGKGFAVIAAWTGLPGLLLLVIGTLLSTIYFWSSAGTVTPQTPLPGNFAAMSDFLAVLSYTVGEGLLAISCIFLGIVIARGGRRLWPDAWVAYGYAGIAIGAIALGSAIQVVLAPTGGQASLTTPAVLLFALWSFWFGVMVVRLKPE